MAKSNGKPRRKQPESDRYGDLGLDWERDGNHPGAAWRQHEQQAGVDGVDVPLNSTDPLERPPVDVEFERGFPTPPRPDLEAADVDGTAERSEAWRAVASQASWYEIDKLTGEVARMRQQVDQMQLRLETLVDVKMRFEVDPSRNPPERQGKSKKAKGKSEETAAAPREDLVAASEPTVSPSPTTNQRCGGQQKASAAALAPDPDAASPRTTHASTGGGKRTPSVMTPETQEAIIHYVEAGASLRQAAAMVKCNNSTITKFAQRNKEFANRLEMAEDAAEFRPRMRIVKASRQSWRAAAWLLRTHRPSDRQRRERAEQSDRETADSMNRLSRMLREGDPSADVDVKLENGKKKVVKTRDSRKEAAAEWERISEMAKDCGIKCP